MFEKLVKKVIVNLKGGDEANVAKNVETIEAVWKSQIKNGEKTLASVISKFDDEIADQEERIEDAKKAYLESFENISANKMNVDERKSYVIDVYEKQISAAKNKLTSAENKLKRLKETKEAEVKQIQEGIDLYKEFIKTVENIE